MKRLSTISHHVQRFPGHESRETKPRVAWILHSTIFIFSGRRHKREESYLGLVSIGLALNAAASAAAAARTVLLNLRQAG
mmetsp:Transcript_96043/g.244019  ORF Transcript_96043/g.244019 Transcript_96043/m.244019 type:complete len:80 (+) Transcript_96043:220-459(+)